MHKHSSPIEHAPRPSPASRLRNLLDQVKVWTVGLPDVNDAFDADGLPLSFILRRDSQLDAGEGPPERSAPPASRVEPGRTEAIRRGRRGGPRKQMPQE